MDVNNLEKYCFRYDSSICKGYIDEERLKELTTLIQKEREDAIKGYVKWAWNNGLGGLVDDDSVKEYLSQTKGDKK